MLPLTEAATIRRPHLADAVRVSPILAALVLAAPVVHAGMLSASGPGTASPRAAFAATGRPAWTSDAELVLGSSATLLGLAAGGWDWRDPFGSAAMASPGSPESPPPAAWADSTFVRLGQLGAVQGFGAPLARVEATVRRPTARRARAVFTLLNGSSALDRNSLLLARGDERSWFRGGSHGSRRGGVGSMDVSGEHLWFASGGVTRGAHDTWARYTQAGFGNQQVLGGLREGGRGESGEVGWRWGRETRSLEVRARRAHDGRESRGNGIAFAESRRDAAADELALVASDSITGGWWTARLTLGQEHVERVTPTASLVRQAWRADRAWVALEHERVLGNGRLSLALGGGRHSAPERREERLQLAPTLAWEWQSGTRSVRLFADRTLTPVWSDLAVDVPAFMQDVWLGGLEGAVGRRGGSWLEAGVAAGRVAQRATILRYPVRDIALRFGWQRDEGTSPLLLASAAGGAAWRALACDVQGFVQTRPEEQSQPRVDPGVGGSAGLEGRVKLFRGDLDVRLRAQVDVVGERDLESTAYEGVAPQTLPAFSTFGAHLTATIGDATLGVRVTNLEDQRRRQVWIDPVTGEPAKDAGRQLMFEIVWPLFD